MSTEIPEEYRQMVAQCEKAHGFRFSERRLPRMWLNGIGRPQFERDDWEGAQICIANHIAQLAEIRAVVERASNESATRFRRVGYPGRDY